MKALATIMILSGIILSSYRIYTREVSMEIDYNNQIGNNWYMFDESSTISDKAIYIDKYINSLESHNLASNAGIVTQTRSLSYNFNLKALKSLRDRLNEIKGMNPNSFEYQTAIQQITGQETSSDAMYTMHDCWLKANYNSFYNPWLVALMCILQIVLIAGGILLLIYWWENN